MYNLFKNDILKKDHQDRYKTPCVMLEVEGAAKVTSIRVEFKKFRKFFKKLERKVWFLAHEYFRLWQ